MIKPERWEQINRLYDSAMKLEPGQREAFLKDACAGDASLLKELGDLLSTEQEAGSFLEEPAMKVMAGAPAKEQAEEPRPDFTGLTLLHYRIVEKIGEGGMGAVYRGRDEHLGRDVAIKILPTGALSDDAARKRFRKEALALAKLSHPNIGTVYDFTTQDGIDYLVMEYIQGLTLKDTLARGPLSEKEISRLGTQVAEGLAAAHEQRIVHCDLKPSNLIVAPGGLLKILDFGLARLVRPQGQEQSTDSSTQSRVGGTLPYMSPEQLTGERVDGRSDIYAMGNVLYEMATARLPFQEELPTALVNDIGHKLPPPPGRFRPDLSSLLEGVILKCLEKDPENRYQSAKELLVDLRRVGTTDISRVPPKLSPRLVWRSWPVTVSLALAVAILITIVIIHLWTTRISEETLPSYESNELISRTYWVEKPALSPDGTRIAFSSNESGNLDIYVTGIRGSAPLRLTDDAADETDPAWFPDGRIAFTSNRDGKTAIWQVGPTGGGQTLLLEDAFQPAISPDGSMLAFVRAMPNGHCRIGVVALDNISQPRMLTGDIVGVWVLFSPTWSPDGRVICYTESQDLWTIPISGGQAKRLTSDHESNQEPAWSPDGRYVYFSSYREGALALWRVSANGGSPQRVTLGTTHECHPSISRDGRLLVHATNRTHRQLLLLDVASGKEQPLAGFEWNMASIAPDRSKIVFVSTRSGSGTNLWVQPLHNGKPSSSPYRLTERSGDESYPAFSPDGRWIAYYWKPSKKGDIWIIPASGGQPVQFTNDPATALHPAWSPDGSAIAFVSTRDGSLQIWSGPVRDGKPAGPVRQLTNGNPTAFAPAWSRDGATIAFGGMQNGQNEVWLVPSDGSAPAHLVTQGANIRRLRWNWATGDLIVSGGWGEGRTTLRIVSPETRDIKVFQSHIELGGKDSPGLFDISADGKLLVFSREVTNGEIWVLRANRGGF